MPRFRFFLTLFIITLSLFAVIATTYYLRNQTDIRSKAAGGQAQMCSKDGETCCVSVKQDGKCTYTGVCKKNKCVLGKTGSIISPTVPPIESPRSTPTPTIPPNNPPTASQKLQLSTWIDANLVSEPGAGTRGYWKNISVAPDMTVRPSADEIKNAKNVLRKTYHVNLIYLIITRQYDIGELKKLVLEWKKAEVTGASNPIIIPTLVLQNYVDNGCNFTNDELKSFVQFLKTNINSQAIAVMDVYNIQLDKNRSQCSQLTLIKDTHGGELHRVGLQYSESLGQPFTHAVIDAYSGLASGKTKGDWMTKCGFNSNGNEISAEKMLRQWVKLRVNSSVNVAWNLIAVAKDYTQKAPCGEDTVKDVPLEAGRNSLVRDLIIEEYPGGVENPLFKGFSFDFKVLDDYAKYFDAKDRRPYTMLRSGAAYAGYYSAPLNEIAKIFDMYDD